MSHEAWPGNEEQKVILGGVLREATKGKDAWGMPEGRPRGHVTGRGTWGSMELGGVLGEATKGACYCGEGHGDHLKSVDWKRGRGLADGYLRAANRGQSWMYGLKTGGAGWL